MTFGIMAGDAVDTFRITTTAVNQSLFEKSNWDRYSSSQCFMLAKSSVKLSFLGYAVLQRNVWAVSNAKMN